MRSIHSIYSRPLYSYNILWWVQQHIDATTRQLIYIRQYSMVVKWLIRIHHYGANKEKTRNNLILNKIQIYRIPDTSKLMLSRQPNQFFFLLLFFFVSPLLLFSAAFFLFFLLCVCLNPSPSGPTHNNNKICLFSNEPKRTKTWPQMFSTRSTVRGKKNWTSLTCRV